MSSTYSTNLAIELIGTGDQAGTWGTTTNTNLGTLIEQAISGYVTQAITDGADTVITIPNGATGTARNMAIECTGILSAARNLIVPANKKLYLIYNNTSGGYAVTVKVSGQTGVSVPNGAKVWLVSNGTDIVVATNYMAALTLGTALPVASGGTGTTTSTGSGAVVLASGASLTSPSMSAPTITGTSVAPTQAFGDNTTKLATTAFVQAALQALYPVGSIYSSTVSTNPNTLFGFGTWVAYASGRVLIGDGGGFTAGATGGSADAITVSHTHTFSATTGSAGQHYHGFGYNTGDNSGWFGYGSWSQANGFPGGNSVNWNGSGGGTGYPGQQTSGNMQTTGAISWAGGEAHTHSVSGSVGTTGLSGTNANLQPYVVVYMWNRTA